MSGECPKCHEHTLDCKCGNTLAKKRKLHCDCGQEKDYSEKWDAYYCKKCNIWLEPMCTEKECSICKGRPQHPIPPLDFLTQQAQDLNMGY